MRVTLETKNGQERSVTIGFLTILILFLFISFLTWMSYRQLESTNRWIIHTYDVQHHLNRLRYELTQHDQEHKIIQRIEALKNLTADNPHQQEEIRKLSALFKKNLSSTETAETHTILTNLANDEKKLLLERKSDAAKTNQRSVFLLITGGLLSLGIILVCLKLFLITSRKRFESELRLRETQEELKKNELLFHSLFEFAPDSMIIVDSTGRILKSNSMTKTIFGWSPDELTGRKIEMLVPDRHHANHVQHRQRYSQTPTSRAMGVSGMNLFGKKKNGTEFPIAISLGPFQLQNNLVTIAITRDISLEKETEEKIKNLNKTLKEKLLELETTNKELEAFSYSVSHDLRAPLRSMIGFSNILMEDHSSKLTTEQKGLLEKIINASQRMGLLIDGLLGLSRLTRKELKTESINLSHIAKEITEHLKQSDPNRQVTIKISEDLKATGDPDLIYSAMDNLLNNAWKFTSHASHADIEIGSLNNGSTFYVKDNGAGFDMKYADKLFGAFQRLHGPKDFPGTGIGLATVQRIIRRHGGKIWAESQVDKGTTFYFTL